jgi:two-component system copper resistance phosphate regulon response regulator CusR
MKLLVVEDDPKTAAFLVKGLAENGFSVDAAGDGERGAVLLRQASYDLVVLDLMLPKKDGWSLLEEIRGGKQPPPVLILTARDGLEDRVRGLNLGADDYLVKPFAFSELLARVRSVLRRGPPRVQEVLKVGDLEVDVVRHRVTRAGRKLELTPKEFSLLALLVRRSGEVLSRTLIAEQVWEINFDCGTNIVDVHIRRLRAKVDEGFERKLVHTVRGIGYVAEVRD